MNNIIKITANNYVEFAYFIIGCSAFVSFTLIMIGVFLMKYKRSLNSTSYSRVFGIIILSVGIFLGICTGFYIWVYPILTPVN